MKAMTQEQAEKAWKTNINRMVAFAPDTYKDAKEYMKGRWLLVDGCGVLGIGFSLEDCIEMRDTLKRKRG